jgi:5-methylcytosine-specific restriction endonuclease McrA
MTLVRKLYNFSIFEYAYLKDILVIVVLKNNDFSFLVDKEKVFKAQQKLERIFKSNSKKNDEIPVGTHHGHWYIQAYFLRDYGFWWGKWEEREGKRIVNVFGLGEPNWEKGNDMNCQINLPYSKPNLCVGGTLAVNFKGEMYIAHSGRMGGSRKGISMDGFRKLFPKKTMWKTITDGKKTKDYVLISAINDKKFLSKLEYFILEYHKIKEKLIQDASVKSSKRKSSVYDKIEKLRSKIKSKKQNNRSKKRSNQKNGENFDDEEEAFTKVVKKLPRSDIDKMIRNYQAMNSQNKKSVTSKSYFRDPVLSVLMKEKHKHTCQLCNQRTFLGRTGNLYTESHHVIPRSKNGPDLPNNILILCPTCHKIFDKGTPDVLIDTYRKIKRDRLFSNFEGLLKAKEITKPMYQKILK